MYSREVNYDPQGAGVRVEYITENELQLNVIMWMENDTMFGTYEHECYHVAHSQSKQE